MYRWTLTNLADMSTEVLSKDPIGWDESVYTLRRSKKYKSVLHEFSTSFKFHCNGGGRQFIDNVYNTYDIDGRIDLLVEYKCNESGEYETLFNGIINLATYAIEGEYTVCQIERSDLMAKFLSRDEISVDLETTTSIGGETITAIDASDINLESVSIPFISEWTTPNGSIVSGGYAGGSLSDLVRDTWIQPDMNATTSEIVNSYSITELVNSHVLWEQFGQSAIMPLVTSNDSGITYPLTVSWSINWQGEYRDTNNEVDARENIASKLLLLYGQKNTAINTAVTLLDLSGYTSDAYTYTFNIVDSGTISLNSGDSVWLAWRVFDSDTDGLGAPVDYTIEIEFTADSTFTLSALTTSETSVVKTVLVHEAFNQIVDAIADSDTNFYSEFYGRTNSAKTSYLNDGCGSNLVITNGLNIRELDRPIYASFTELFEAMDCLHNIGAGYVNNKIQVEQLSYWYDINTKIITLPSVNDFSTKNDNTQYYNKILIGYEKWESEFRGGLDDVNTQHEYSTKIASVKNIYQRLCKYIASSYSIEFTRRKKSTNSILEDWRYDNDNFLLATVNHIRVNAVFQVNAGDDSIIITGNQYTSYFSASDSIVILGSVSNDGTYTVTSVTFTITQTIVKVSQALVSESLVEITIENTTTPFYGAELLEDAFSAGSGMDIINSAYNLSHTPKRMLLAHLNVLTSGLQKINGAINFVKADGNSNLVTTKNMIAYTSGCQEDYNSVSLAENASINWNDSNAQNISPIYLPEIYTFEYPLTYDQFKTIKANPNGYIEFYKFSDEIKNGFILTMEYGMKTGMTKFELIKANV